MTDENQAAIKKAEQSADQRPDIIVVDDDECVLSSITMMLQHLGCLVTAFTSGASLLAASKDILPHQVIILDQNMPTLSGTDTHHKLRESGVLNPICFLTGSLYPSSIEEILKTDSSCRTIQKPISLKTMRLLLEQLTALA